MTTTDEANERIARWRAREESARARWERREPLREQRRIEGVLRFLPRSTDPYPVGAPEPPQGAIATIEHNYGGGGGGYTDLVVHLADGWREIGSRLPGTSWEDLVIPDRINARHDKSATGFGHVKSVTVHIAAVGRDALRQVIAARVDDWADSAAENMPEDRAEARGYQAALNDLHARVDTLTIGNHELAIADLWASRATLTPQSVIDAIVEYFDNDPVQHLVNADTAVADTAGERFEAIRADTLRLIDNRDSLGSGPTRGRLQRLANQHGSAT